MNYVECVNKGNDLTHQAVAFDEQQDYHKAFQKYMLAFDYYQMASERAPTPNMREMIRSKIRDFIERAEQIKEILDQKKKNACAAAKKVASGDAPTDGGEFANFEKMLASTILNERPDLKLEQVAGLEEAKNALMEAVIGPIQVR